MRRFVTSDLHFSHKNIIAYCQRPFADVKEMNEVIIKNWNEVVKKDDMVYVLGDFSFCSREMVKELVSKLNGRKILVGGNHDNFSPKFYLEAGFEMVTKSPIIVDGDFILSHQPLAGDLGKFFNIHGHRHTLPTETEVSPKHMDIGVDNHNFYPHNLDTVEKTLYHTTRKGARFKKRTIAQRIGKFLKMPFYNMK